MYSNYQCMRTSLIPIAGSLNLQFHFLANKSSAVAMRQEAVLMHSA